MKSATWRRIIVASAMASSIVALTLATAEAPQADAGAMTQRVRESKCIGEAGAELVDAEDGVCEREIELSVEPECPICPGGINAVFVQIKDAPQNGWQNDESVDAYDEMLNRTPEGVKLSVAVLHYSGDSTVKTVLRPTDDERKIRAALSQSENGYDPQSAAIARAAQQAVRLLRDMENDKDLPRGVEPCRQIVVMFGYTKSHMAEQRDAMLDAADTIKRSGADFFVGCPQAPGSWYCRVTPEMPRKASEHSEYNDHGEFQRMVRRALNTFGNPEKIRDIILSQRLPTGLAAVADSWSATDDVVPVITEEDEGSLVQWTWSNDYALVNETYTATYRVHATETGKYLISGDADLVDNTRAVKTLELPEIEVELELCAPPTPTPTATNTPIPTDTPTPTSTPLPTDTPTPTNTATPSSYTVYLPIARHDEEPCVPESIYADTVLVLDMSTSMERPTSSGRTKREAALEAARVFVDQLELEPDHLGRHDRVAIVGFNDAAWTASEMSSDAAAIDGAIGGLTERVDHGTRLDLALIQGQAALSATERIDGNRSTMILLTDGLPNRVPLHPVSGRQEETVLDAADAAKGAGTRVFTIGLGSAEDIARSLLQMAASELRDYYEAPDGEDLSSIYRQIAGRITECPEP